MIPSTIAKYLECNHVATLCAGPTGELWCFNCFYLFIESDQVLVFRSTEGSRHFKLLADHPFIAGTVLPDSIDFQSLQGVQLEGNVLSCNKYYLKKIEQLYFDKYPLALDKEGITWAVRLVRLKMTDNSRGFGFKETWEKEADLLPGQEPTLA